MTNVSPVASLGERIRERRDALGLTQRQLADLCGISPDRISHYERGQRVPDNAMIQVIAKALKLSPAYLAFGNIDEKIGEFETDQESPKKALKAEKLTQDQTNMLMEIFEIADRARAKSKSPVSTKRAAVVVAYFFQEALSTGRVNRSGIELLMTAD